MIRLIVSVLSAVIPILISPLTLSLSAALLIGAWWISRQGYGRRPRLRASAMEIEWPMGLAGEWLGT